jgi:hypothetical protein
MPKAKMRFEGMNVWSKLQSDLDLRPKQDGYLSSADGRMSL